jgi:predicted NACHT family NTPase
MVGAIDFQPYLNSICHDYPEWWKLYTPTDIKGKRKASSEQNKRTALFDFGLMMQSIETRKPEALYQKRTEKPERRPVLEGLRKSLTEAKHILLIGRPGSGKSTALARLLLEEAQHSQGNADAKCNVPVLVELRYYQTTVFELIREFFKRHGLPLETHQIEQLQAALAYAASLVAQTDAIPLGA